MSRKSVRNDYLNVIKAKKKKPIIHPCYNSSFYEAQVQLFNLKTRDNVVIRQFASIISFLYIQIDDCSFLVV